MVWLSTVAKKGVNSILFRMPEATVQGQQQGAGGAGDAGETCPKWANDKQKQAGDVLFVGHDGKNVLIVNSVTL